MSRVSCLQKNTCFNLIIVKNVNSTYFIRLLLLKKGYETSHHFEWINKCQRYNRNIRRDNTRSSSKKINKSSNRKKGTHDTEQSMIIINKQEKIRWFIWCIKLLLHTLPSTDRHEYIIFGFVSVCFVLNFLHNIILNWRLINISIDCGCCIVLYAICSQPNTHAGTFQ